MRTRRTKNNDIVHVTCYNKRKEYKRQEALDFFFEGMMCSEGSERDRYTNIYEQLMLGYKECYDEV